MARSRVGCRSHGLDPPSCRDPRPGCGGLLASDGRKARTSASRRIAARGETGRAAAELGEARRLSADGRFSSIARLKAAQYFGVPKVRALYEATYLVGLRKGRDAGRMTATLRLAAIVAADVAGYSRLMGADEEGTHERLKAHRRELVGPKIGGHSGRIVKTTGDGMLMQFASVPQGRARRS